MPAITVSLAPNSRTDFSSRACKKIPLHLHLPLTPITFEDSDFAEDDMKYDDFPRSSGVNSPSWPTEDWDPRTDVTPSPEYKSVFEDWDDDDDGVFETVLEVSLDDEGAQVLCIPSDNPFHLPPPPTKLHTQIIQPRDKPHQKLSLQVHNLHQLRGPRFFSSPITAAEIRVGPQRAEISALSPYSSSSSWAVATRGECGEGHAQSAIPILFCSPSSLVGTWCSPLTMHPPKHRNALIHGIKRDADVPWSAWPSTPA